MSEMTLHVESSAEAPRLMRSHLETLKGELGPRYDDIVLLVSELVTNSVVHTGSHDIDLSILTGDHRIRVEVTDEGPGFADGHPRGDGMGLNIIEKLADEWGISNNDGFTVWAEVSKD